jgi:hypothetical protein
MKSWDVGWKDEFCREGHGWKDELLREGHGFSRAIKLSSPCGFSR